MNEAYINQVFWHSRRGMLELDLLLVPFVKEGGFAALNPEQQAAYERLIALEDPVLFDWFLGKGEPVEPVHIHMVQHIKAWHAALGA